MKSKRSTRRGGSLEPERGDGVKPAGGRPPSESERGCPPQLVTEEARDQLRRGLAIARQDGSRAEAEGPASAEKSRQKGHN